MIFISSEVTPQYRQVNQHKKSSLPFCSYLDRQALSDGKQTNTSTHISIDGAYHELVMFPPPPDDPDMWSFDTFKRNSCNTLVGVILNRNAVRNKGEEGNIRSWRTVGEISFVHNPLYFNPEPTLWVRPFLTALYPSETTCIYLASSVLKPVICTICFLAP